VTCSVDNSEISRIWPSTQSLQNFVANGAAEFIEKSIGGYFDALLPKLDATRSEVLSLAQSARDNVELINQILLEYNNSLIVGTDFQS